MTCDIEGWRIHADLDRHALSLRRRIQQTPSIGQWRADRALGSGGFAEVQLEKNQKTGQFRAVKKMIATENEELKRELLALIQFSTPKFQESGIFVNFYGWYSISGNVHLAMEHVPHGDLHEYMESNPGQFSEHDSRAISEQILMGLEMMHAESFIHADIKPRNILIASIAPYWRVKLCDFGLTRKTTENLKWYTRGGTQGYMAPEQLFLLSSMPTENVVTSAVDVWSAGCILYRLITGVVPFPKGPSLIQYCEDVSLFPRNPFLDESIQNSAFKLLQQMLESRPGSRPSATGALDHDWFKISPAADTASCSVGVLDEKDPEDHVKPIDSGRIQRKEMHLSSIGNITAAISEQETLSVPKNLKATAVKDLIRLTDLDSGNQRGILSGHTDWINCVLLSPDGQLLASGSSDTTIRLWDATDGAEKMTLIGHRGAVTSVSFSTGQNLIASASHDGTIKVWDISSGDVHRTLDGHDQSVLAVAFAPDDKFIASASRDKSVRAWTMATDTTVRKLGGHTDWVTAVEFSKDSRIVASASLDKTVRLWDTRTGESLGVLQCLINWMYPVVFDTDNRAIRPVRPDMSIGLRQPSAEAKDGEFTTWFASVIFSSDGTLLACATRDKTVQLWDLRSKNSYGTLKCHMNGSDAILFEPDGLPAKETFLDENLSHWRKVLII